MKPNLLWSLAVSTAVFTGAHAQVSGQPAEPPPAAAPTEVAPPQPDAKETKAKSARPARQSQGFPFRGKLKAIDKDAMTITVAGKEKDRVFKVTSQTRFTKGGKPATLGDAVVDEEVAGYARNAKDGVPEATSVRFGALPATAKKTPARKAKPDSPSAPATQ